MSLGSNESICAGQAERKGTYGEAGDSCETSRSKPDPGSLRGSATLGSGVRRARRGGPAPFINGGLGRRLALSLLLASLAGCATAPTPKLTPGGLPASSFPTDRYQDCNPRTDRAAAGGVSDIASGAAEIRRAAESLVRPGVLGDRERQMALWAREAAEAALKMDAEGDPRAAAKLRDAKNLLDAATGLRPERRRPRPAERRP